MLSRLFWMCVLIGAIASKAGPAVALGITVSPTTAMLDEPIAIHVQGRPGSMVTLTGTTERFGLTFESRATYRIPKTGGLNLSMQAPFSGSYSITSGMGLFWSMMPNSSPPKPFEFRRDSDLDARPYGISVADGANKAHVSATRVVLADNVSRKVVDDGSMIATIFTPGTRSCSPGVIVLGGSDGGVPEEEAAVLAGHSFTTLALAYFGAPGLSPTLTNVPIEIVQHALQFMHDQPGVCHSRIGLLGASKGAELALVAASRFPDVGAVVAYSPASVVFAGIGGKSEPALSSWTFQGVPLPFATGTTPDDVVAAIRGERQAHRQVSYRRDYLAQLQGNTDKAAEIAVEQIRGPLLLIAGGDDLLWPSDVMAGQIMERLRANHHPYSDQLLLYSSAGHPIGVPFEFAEAELAHSSLALGGTGESNERADEASWPLVIRFLNAALR
jgi:dienelactone hydrolase